MTRLWRVRPAFVIPNPLTRRGCEKPAFPPSLFAGSFSTRSTCLHHVGIVLLFPWAYFSQFDLNIRVWMWNLIGFAFQMSSATDSDTLSVLTAESPRKKQKRKHSTSKFQWEWSTLWPCIQRTHKILAANPLVTSFPYTETWDLWIHSNWCP